MKKATIIFCTLVICAGAPAFATTQSIDFSPGGFTGMGGFSGSITTPEPATVALLGLGSLALLRKRRQNTK